MDTIALYAHSMFRHLWSYANIISVIPFLLGPYASKIQQVIPFYPDTWWGTVSLALVIGVLVTSYLIFQDNQKLINSLDKQIQVLNAGLDRIPQIEVKLSDRKVGDQLRVNLIAIERPDWDKMTERADRWAWQNYEAKKKQISNEVGPFGIGFRHEYLVGERQYSEDVKRFRRLSRIYGDHVYNYCSVRANKLLIDPVITNVSDASLSAAILEIVIPHGCRVAGTVEVDWITGERLFQPPSPPRAAWSVGIPTAVMTEADYDGEYVDPKELSDDLSVNIRDRRQVVRYTLGSIPAGDRRDDLSCFYIVFDEISPDYEDVNVLLLGEELSKSLEFNFGLDVALEDDVLDPSDQFPMFIGVK